MVPWGSLSEIVRCISNTGVVEDTHVSIQRVSWIARPNMESRYSLRKWGRSMRSLSYIVRNYPLLRSIIPMRACASGGAFLTTETIKRADFLNSFELNFVPASALTQSDAYVWMLIKIILNKFHSVLAYISLLNPYFWNAVPISILCKLFPSAAFMTSIWMWWLYSFVIESRIERKNLCDFLCFNWQGWQRLCSCAKSPQVASSKSSTFADSIMCICFMTEGWPEFQWIFFSWDIEWTLYFGKETWGR